LVWSGNVIHSPMFLSTSCAYWLSPSGSARKKNSAGESGTFLTLSAR
jgi:hypothetical protein